MKRVRLPERIPLTVAGDGLRGNPSHLPFKKKHGAERLRMGFFARWEKGLRKSR